MNPDEIKDRFSHFPPAVAGAIREFQCTRDPALVAPILQGILRKHLPEDDPVVQVGTPPQAALDTLNFDSITLIEIMLDLQDVLGIHLADEEMRDLHDVEGVRTLLLQKVGALSRSK